tara:strand:- start:11 stop:454 length:444 start_codon:yes stop_codon:yes gene_type:complete
MKYESTKTFGNDRGLSCCFRQWRADSHCNLIHGYSLGFKFTFEADTLDDRNWVYDFGDCKWIKLFLEDNFDHTLVIASDDPRLGKFKELYDTGLARLKVIHGVGCEKFSEFVFQYVSPIVMKQTLQRVKLKSVEVFEHGANSAIYLG